MVSSTTPLPQPSETRFPLLDSDLPSPSKTGNGRKRNQDLLQDTFVDEVDMQYERAPLKVWL